MASPPIALWDVDARLIGLLRGHRNVAFRTVGLADDLVFKTTRRNEAAIDWLVPVLTLAAQSGFAVASPLKSKSGQYIEDGWTCEPFIRGKHFGPEDMPRIAEPLSRFQRAQAFIRQRPGFLSASDLLHYDVGGDINLTSMPKDIVATCRAAWSAIRDQPTCIVHGDLNPGNLIHTEDGRIGLIDWDECRVDAALFDTYRVAPNASDNINATAILAWEIASSWTLEPDYARNLAGTLK